MISLTTGQLDAWLAQVLWPFIRVGSCFMVAPAFGALFVPARIRIVLAGAETGSAGSRDVDWTLRPDRPGSRLDSQMTGSIQEWCRHPKPGPE